MVETYLWVRDGNSVIAVRVHVTVSQIRSLCTRMTVIYSRDLALLDYIRACL